MVCPSPGSRNDMVDREVRQLEVRFASVAVTALLAIQKPSVPHVIVADQCPDIGALRDVRAVDHRMVREHAKLIPEPQQHQFSGLRRDVNPNPLPVKVLRRYARRRAAAERVQNHVALVGTRGDDPFRK